MLASGRCELEGRPPRRSVAAVLVRFSSSRRFGDVRVDST
jgi:hypothetical protein